MDYRALLDAELTKRRAVNPTYSLRAFSKHLGLSPAQVSQVLSGKRPLTAKAAVKIADRLRLSPIERRRLIEATLQADEGAIGQLTQNLEEEEFRVISDWYHLAILSLLEVPKTRLEPREIARQLGITALQSSQAIRRLMNLGFIEKTPKGFRLRQVSLRIRPESRSTAVGRYHQQLLTKGSEAVDNVAIEKREFCAMTFAMDPKDIPEAKRRITDFIRSLSTLLEGGQKKKAVYSLAVQLFPLTQESKNETLH